MWVAQMYNKKLRLSPHILLLPLLYSFSHYFSTIIFLILFVFIFMFSLRQGTIITDGEERVQEMMPSKKKTKETIIIALRIITVRYYSNNSVLLYRERCAYTLIRDR